MICPSVKLLILAKSWRIFAIPLSKIIANPIIQIFNQQIDLIQFRYLIQPFLVIYAHTIPVINGQFIEVSQNLIFVGQLTNVID